MSDDEQHSRGWYSRGYLPHFDQPDLLQGITIRLHDALPQSVLDSWELELRHLGDTAREIERKRRIEHYLDAGHGSCLLRENHIAAVVENALLFFDGQRYRLIAWCVMPNHVHVLIECQDGWALAEVIHSWKSYTVHEINKLLLRSGHLWQREYHDRFIRDDGHFANAVRYIEENPVKASLVSSAEKWLWSSARRH